MYTIEIRIPIYDNRDSIIGSRGMLHTYRFINPVAAFKMAAHLSCEGEYATSVRGPDDRQMNYLDLQHDNHVWDWHHHFGGAFPGDEECPF